MEEGGVEMSFIQKIKNHIKLTDPPKPEKPIDPNVKVNKKICAYCGKPGANKRVKVFNFHKKCRKLWKNARKNKGKFKPKWI